MIIGISGKKQSGKDTSYFIVQKILQEWGYTTERYYFARFVKQFAEKYFNVSETTENKEEVRYVWQAIGQMFREEVDENFWIMKEYVAYLQDREVNRALVGVMTDVRYRNEADFLLERKFPLIRIYRPEQTHDDNHPSETELDDFSFSYYIRNSAGLEELEEQWRDVLTKLFHKN